jgi:serine protease Do
MNYLKRHFMTNSKGAFKLSALFLSGALAVGAIALSLSPLAHGKGTSNKAEPPKIEVDKSPLKRDTKLTTSFAPVVKKVSPAVVNVFISSTPKNVSYDSPQMFDEPFFRRFFGDDSNGGNRGNRGNVKPHVPKQRGLGSGVVISKDGYILTNNHVVENADEIKVAFSDGREFVGKVVGKDPKTDVAVLKIDAKDLPVVQFADSDNIEVGDLVLAVGNPFGVGQTVTMGMVSATGRGNMGLDYEDFIQTDAAINPGNSGGALVDAEGRLVGINTAILSRSGGNQGIGFAIPSNLVRNVMDSLIKDGRVVRGFLGVSIQDITPALEKEFNLKQSGGALVGEVTPKSPAEKAGIQSGDVILELNGKQVKDSRHLKLQVASAAPGEKVPVKILRDGSTKNLEVTLKELPRTEVASRDGGNDSKSSDALDGVTVDDISPAAKHELKLPEHVKGALVTNVDPNSAAFEAGLREGDVIQEINRKQVDGADKAVQLTEKVKEKRLLLRVWSRGGSRYLVVDETKAG